MEMFLVKDAGFDLADVRGETEVRRRTVEPAPWERWTAEVAGSWEAGAAALACVLAVGLPLAAAAGWTAAGAFGVVASAAGAALQKFEASPRDEVEVVEREGMTEREARQFAVLHDEQERIRKEKAEEDMNNG